MTQYLFIAYDVKCDCRDGQVRYFRHISGPKFAVFWVNVEEILLFNIFFGVSIHALLAKIQPDNFVRWCADSDFCVIFASCISASRVQQVSDMHC